MLIIFDHPDIYDALQQQNIDCQNIDRESLFNLSFLAQLSQKLKQANCVIYSDYALLFYHLVIKKPLPTINLDIPTFSIWETNPLPFIPFLQSLGKNHIVLTLNKQIVPILQRHKIQASIILPYIKQNQIPEVSIEGIGMFCAEWPNQDALDPPIFISSKMMEVIQQYRDQLNQNPFLESYEFLTQSTDIPSYSKTNPFDLYITSFYLGIDQTNRHIQAINTKIGAKENMTNLFPNQPFPRLELFNYFVQYDIQKIKAISPITLVPYQLFSMLDQSYLLWPTQFILAKPLWLFNKKTSTNFIYESIDDLAKLIDKSKNTQFLNKDFLTNQKHLKNSSSLERWVNYFIDKIQLRKNQ